MKMWRNWNSHHQLVGMENKVDTWKTVWQFLKISNTKLPSGPALPLPDPYPREMKTHAHTNTCTFMFIATFFIIAIKWKSHKYPPADE